MSKMTSDTSDLLLFLDAHNEEYKGFPHNCVRIFHHRLFVATYTRGNCLFVQKFLVHGDPKRSTSYQFSYIDFRVNVKNPFNAQ